MSKGLLVFVALLVVVGGGMYVYLTSQPSPAAPAGDTMMKEEGVGMMVPEGDGMMENAGGDMVVEDDGSMMEDKGDTMMKDEDSMMGGDAMMSAVKTFEVEGSNFAFSLKEIKVKKGDKVKVVFKNVSGFHDWVLDEFSAKTPQIQAGNTAEVEFVADKTGTFEYYCSVGQHRQMGMVGNLIVE